MIITGGNGFIGSALARQMPKAEVWNRESGTIYPTDVLIHMAASTHLAIGYDRSVIEDNIVLANRVAESGFSRLVYASSSAIHNPNNLYAYSKMYAEELFKPFNSTGLRYYTVYGPNDIGVVGKLIDCALNDKPFNIYGGLQIRDFVYIDDVVKATIDSIESKEKIIEVGTGVGLNIIELRFMIEELTGKKINCHFLPPYDFEAQESICPTPLKQFTALEEGRKKTIEWHLQKK